MKKIDLKSGLFAVMLGIASPAALSLAQSAPDYQTLASSQFSEPRQLAAAALKIKLQPAAPLQAELDHPTAGRRILMVVRGTRPKNAPVVPINIYWNVPEDAHTLDDDRLLGAVTLTDRFGGKDHTTVLDVTDKLRALARIKEIPEPMTPPPPSVTVSLPGITADDRSIAPSLEEVLLVVTDSKMN